MSAAKKRHKQATSEQAQVVVVEQVQSDNIMWRTLDCCRCSCRRRRRHRHRWQATTRTSNRKRTALVGRGSAMMMMMMMISVRLAALIVLLGSAPSLVQCRSERTFGATRQVATAEMATAADQQMQLDEAGGSASSAMLAPALALRAAAVSARGSLAFIDPSRTQPASAEPQAAPSPSGHHQSSSGSSPLTASSAIEPANIKCLARRPASAELLALEGATVQVNFVILGSQLWPSAGGARPSRPSGAAKQQQLEPGGTRLKLVWQRDGIDLGAELNQAHGRLTSVQLAAEHGAETIGQLLAWTTSKQDNSTSKIIALPNGAQSQTTTKSAQSHSFMLANYFNERQLNKLDPDGAGGHLLSPLARQQASTMLKRAAAQQRYRASQMDADEIIADGQVIDWRALGGLLRSDDCIEPAGAVEQLLVIQLELSGARLDDRGHYQLFVCQQQQQQHSSASSVTAGLGQTGPSGGRALAGCMRNTAELVASLHLQLVEDVPRLESHFDAQLLEPGDRLSIKCEASGFTLPQISWFLDGQPLSETTAPTSALGQRALANLGQPTHLRIGDYVATHDKRVHSFVNATSVRTSDGGFYKCQANNGLHQVEHEARIDIRGPIQIDRPLAWNMSALAGASELRLQCPYSGHPLGAVEWYYRAMHNSDQSDLFAQSVPMRLTRTERRAKRNERRPGMTVTNSQQQQQQQQQLIRPFEVGAGSATAELDHADSSSSKNNNDDDDDDDSGSPPDPDRDEWLGQANEMTPGPISDDYPEPLPDYQQPAGVLLYEDGTDDASTLEQADELLAQSGQQQQHSVQLLDYAPDQRRLQHGRKRRQIDTTAAGQQLETTGWLKLPQSRRHQVHALNGTLVIIDVGQMDTGAYKCRALGPPVGGSNSNNNNNNGGQDSPNGAEQQQAVAVSNELHLSVLVPPVIAPFGSLDSLREGMRNFLTCSVIEGDSPVRLRWFKDREPLEEYAERQTQHHQQQQPRIRIETSNEFTSTVYFSQVELNDSGNYTCMATNKAASTNYTSRMLVNVPPKWIKAPKDVECIAGQSIVIDCQAEAHPSPRIWWEIGTGEPISSKLSHADQQAINMRQLSAPHQHPPNHYRTIVSNSRMHMLENASLVIRDVGRQDAAFYLCQAANSFGTLSALIKLTVNVGASFSQKYQVKYVKLNERVELDCDPNGQWPVTVTWFVHNNSNNNNKHMPHTMPNNGTNGASGGIRSGATMSVNQSLSLIAVDGQDLSPAPPNGRRLFSADIRTADLPDQTAPTSRTSDTSLQNNFVLEPSERHKTIEIDSSMSFEVLKRRHLFGGPTTATANNQQPTAELVRLNLRQARRSNSGDYVCQATNRFGSDEKLIKLLVQEAPDPVQDISVVRVDSRSVSLAWQTPFNGNSPITSYTIAWAPAIQAQQTVEHLANQKDWSHLVVQQAACTIGPLEPMTTYEVRVRAHNQFGVSRAPSAGTGSLLVTTSEQPPSSPPADIRTVALSSSQLQVSWLAPGQQHHHHTPQGNNDSNNNNNNNRDQKSTIKGYYLGYRAIASPASGDATSTVDNSTSSYVFKTVSLFQFNNGGDSAPSAQHDIMEFGGSRMAEAGQSELVHRTSASSSSSSSNSSVDNNNSNKNNNSPATNNKRLRVIIGDLKRATRYAIIVQPFNSAGPGPQSDPVEARTLANDPPPPATLRSGLATETSVHLHWSLGVDEHEIIAQQQARTSTTNKPDLAAITVDGYHLYYRARDDEWQDKKLDPSNTVVQLPLMNTGAGSAQQSVSSASSLSGGGAFRELTIVELSPQQKHRLNHTVSFASVHQPLGGGKLPASFRFVLDHLQCGTAYQIYLVAYNSYGSGSPSQLIRTKTRGSLPGAPRRQDFLLVNSTSVRLQLAAWSDSGCRLTNFEIRYKQLAGGRAEALNLIQQQQHQQQQQQLTPKTEPMQSRTGWLLVSDNIDPEQKSLIELRDLQPETWYAVAVCAESAAGKHEQTYAFMTLDRNGQLSSEALALDTIPAQANLPALFRATGNASIRSILNNWAQPNGSSAIFSPFILSACMCLIVLATCSLLLIKRYNSSLDAAKESRTSAHQLDEHYGTAAANRYHRETSASGLYMAPATAATKVGNVQSHVNLDSSSSSCRPYDHDQELHSSSASPGDQCQQHHQQQQYSMLQSSPSKTGSSALVTTATNSSASTNGSSSALLLGPPGSSLCGTDSVSLAGYGAHEHQQQQAIDLGSFATCRRVVNPSPQMSQFHCAPNCALAVAAAAAAAAAEAAASNQHKFATLHHGAQQQQTAAELLLPQHQQCPNGAEQPNQTGANSAQFKTLPGHLSRPLSTFLPPPNTKQATCQQQQQQRNFLCTPGVQDATSPDLIGTNVNQQQIYSKLRLLQHYNQLNNCSNQIGEHYQRSDSENPHQSSVCNDSANSQQLLQADNQCQQQQTSAPSQSQDDYALPFPPKWV